jgi:hypothetical protein
MKPADASCLQAIHPLFHLGGLSGKSSDETTEVENTVKSGKLMALVSSSHHLLASDLKDKPRRMAHQAGNMAVMRSSSQ